MWTPRSIEVPNLPNLEVECANPKAAIAFRVLLDSMDGWEGLGFI